MIKNLTVSLVAIFTLTACDDWWEGISSTGEGSEKPASTQVVDLSADTPSNAETDAPTGSASDPEDVVAKTESTDAPVQPSNSSAATAESEDVKSQSSLDKCVVGRYAFITTSNNKMHFDARFEAGGHIRYSLNGGPSGKWSLVGDKMEVYGPLKMPGRKYTTLHMVVSKRGSDCKVLEFLGKSPGGQNLAGRRM